MSRIPEVASVPVEDNAKNFDEEYEVDGGDGDEGGKEEEEEEDEQTDLFQNVSNLIDGRMKSSAQSKRGGLPVVSFSSHTCTICKMHASRHMHYIDTIAPVVSS